MKVKKLANRYRKSKRKNWNLYQGYLTQKSILLLTAIFRPI